MSEASSPCTSSQSWGEGPWKLRGADKKASSDDAIRERIQVCIEQWPRRGLEDAEAIARLEFMLQARESPVPFEINSELVDARMKDAAVWVAETPHAEVIRWREAAVTSLEKRAAILKEMGTCDAWFSRAHVDVKQVSQQFNGPLAEWVAVQAKYVDPEAVQMFRKGARVIGRLACSGVGTPKEYKPGLPSAELRDTCKLHNEQLLKSLRQDPHVEALVQEMKLEASKGLMTDLLPAGDIDQESNLIARRFAIEQGRREDGTIKIRACDDEKESGCNKATQPTEKLHCDGIDWLCALAMILHMAGVEHMKMWKADVTKAYRRIPVHPSDHWMMWVAVLIGDEPMVARHNATPFGATGE